MIGGVVEVVAEGRHLSKSRGFLVAQEQGQEVGKVPLDQIDALILSARSTTVSRTLLSALTGNGSVVVLSGNNFEPEAIILPAQGRGHSIGHPEDQAAATKAFHGKLWKQLVQRKIEHQAAVLERMGAKSSAITRLKSLATRVKAGDSENLEAAAARVYFPALYGKGFTRNRNAPGINGHLNYGYAILRAACARSICAVGLSPALGMHHRNRRNPLCLADDVIELFRPLVDHLVAQQSQSGTELLELTPEDKRHLAQVLELPMLYDHQQKPVTNAIHQTALEIAKAYANRQHQIALPEIQFQAAFIS